MRASLVHRLSLPPRYENGVTLTCQARNYDSTAFDTADRERKRFCAVRLATLTLAPFSSDVTCKVPLTIEYAEKSFPESLRSDPTSTKIPSCTTRHCEREIEDRQALICVDLVAVPRRLRRSALMSYA